MPGLNRIQLIGRLGRDPESRTTTGNRSVATFSLAVDRRWKTDGGESKEATDWFTVDAWGRLGEICQKYLAKGRLIFVDGRVQTDRWQDDKGETHYRTKVVAANMQILDRKPDEPEGAEAEEETVAATA
ncbi:MAG TPA: single-stranded DNA-binding protein [Anaerolineales bacterium]|nr:single-stranded DNA-binding protein [Anaerolineales bacterium]